MAATPLRAVPSAFAWETDSTFARILVPFDFSAGAQRALAAALAMKRSFGSKIHLFHMATPGNDARIIRGVGGAEAHVGDLALETESRLLRFVERLFPEHGGEIAVHAGIGADLVQGIERAAADARATLVLLSARQKQTVFRTQVEKVVRSLDCAVMIVCAPRAGAPS